MGDSPSGRWSPARAKRAQSRASSVQEGMAVPLPCRASPGPEASSLMADARDLGPPREGSEVHRPLPCYTPHMNELLEVLKSGGTAMVLTKLTILAGSIAAVIIRLERPFFLPRFAPQPREPPQQILPPLLRRH